MKGFGNCFRIIFRSSFDFVVLPFSIYLQIMFKDDGKSKGFGFVAFGDPEAAEKAVEELNGKELNEGKVSFSIQYY